MQICKCTENVFHVPSVPLHLISDSYLWNFRLFQSLFAVLTSFAPQLVSRWWLLSLILPYILLRSLLLVRSVHLFTLKCHKAEMKDRMFVEPVCWRNKSTNFNLNRSSHMLLYDTESPPHITTQTGWSYQGRSCLYVDFMHTENTNPSKPTSKAASMISCMRIGYASSNLDCLDTALWLSLDAGLLFICAR